MFQEARHSCLALSARKRQAGMPVLLIFHDFAVLLGTEEGAGDVSQDRKRSLATSSVPLFPSFTIWRHPDSPLL